MTQTPIARPAAPVSVSDARIDELLANINSIAFEYNRYEYGLPMHQNPERTNLRAAVRNWVDARALLAEVAPAGGVQAPIPAGWKLALKAAVAAIYFDDSSDCDPWAYRGYPSIDRLREAFDKINAALNGDGAQPALPPVSASAPSVQTVRMLSRDEIEKVCGFGVTGTAREWDMIDRAISVFCSANGLTIGTPPSAQPSATVAEVQEPVAVIGPDWTLMYVGARPIAEIARKHGLKIGDKLFATPTGAAAGAAVQPTGLTGDALLAFNQCRAVAHMARALADVHDARAAILAQATNAPIEIIGESSAEIMEWLGDTLNNMDAVDGAEDEWLDPVFEAAQARWPVRAAAPQAGAAQPVQGEPRMLTNLEALQQLWQPCDLPDFRDPAFTKWRELPSDGEFVYRRDPENSLSWLRAPIPQPTKDTP